MRWQPCKTALLVGVCMIGFSGCASLKFGKDNANSGSEIANNAASPSGISSLFKSEEDSAATGGEALRKDKKDPYESCFLLTRLSERRGETEDAEKNYQALLQQRPNDSRIYHRLAVMAVGAGDFAKAEQNFAKAASLAAPTAELLSDIAYCHYLQHRLPEAEKELNEALKLDATYAPAISNLALVVGRQGRIKESFDLFKRVNSEAEAHANLAYVLAQNGDLGQSQQMYLRALTLDNRMKAAAQAALQVKEREEVRKRLSAVVPANAVVVPTADPAGQGPAEPARLPQVENDRAMVSPAPSGDAS